MLRKKKLQDDLNAQHGCTTSILLEVRKENLQAAVKREVKGEAVPKVVVKEEATAAKTNFVDTDRLLRRV